MSKKRNEILFPTFKRINEPDFERISILTKKAMGNRTILSFAEDCGLSKTTISRILNKQLKTSLVDEIVDTIVKNSSHNSGVTLMDFLEANGMVEYKENESYDEPIVKDMETFARPEYAKKFQSAGIKLVESRFNNFGFEYSTIEGHDFDSIPHFAFDIEYETNALIEHGITNWSFDFLYHTKSDNKETFYNRLSKVFASAFLFPNEMQNRAITIVTNATELYEDVLYDFCSAEVTVPISIIFADVISGKIYEEYQIPFKDQYINLEILK